jgi:type VI secretion system secreted protein Hcp
MAVAMYLSIPGVTGECQVDGFSGWIDIFSFSNGVSNPTSVGTGTGSGAGKADFSAISFQKTVDTSTPSLFLTCCSGKHYDKAQLKVLEAGGDANVEFLVVDFTQVFVDNISWGAAGGGGKPSESFSFSFASIQYTYTPQTAKGAAGSPVPFGWNVQTNKKL